MTYLGDVDHFHQLRSPFCQIFFIKNRQKFKFMENIDQFSLGKFYQVTFFVLKHTGLGSRGLQCKSRWWRKKIPLSFLSCDLMTTVYHCVNSIIQIDLQGFKDIFSFFKDASQFKRIRKYLKQNTFHFEFLLNEQILDKICERYYHPA